MKTLARKILFGLILVLPITSFAADIGLFIPRLYLSGYTGTELMGQGDLLAPVYAAEENRVFAVYGQGRYSPVNKEFWDYEAWMGSFGLLYRQIVPNLNNVVGVYVLGDYTRTSGGYKYWMIGPGVESLGRVWDFHLNGYIPIGNRSWEHQGWAQEFGNYSFVEFESGTNNVYDHKLSYHEEVGIGGDAEIGRKLFKLGKVLTKGYVQGYYYNMRYNSDVLGGGVKLTLQPASYITFSANYIYDNYQRNVFVLGAQIRLNDLFTNSNKRVDENNLADRLFDKIDRGYSSIGSGMIAPISKGPAQDLGRGLYSSHTIFIGPDPDDDSEDGDDDGGGDDPVYERGTYNNPYTESDIATRGIQAILDEVHTKFPDKADLYFAPGVYSGQEYPIAFYKSMSAFGKNDSYMLAARGEEKIIFIGTMELPGNNTLDSISIKNKDGLFTTGIIIRNSSNIVLNNVAVGTLTSEGNYITGITMEHSDLAINNSKVYGYQDGVATDCGTINAVGIRMIDGGSLNVFGSEIKGIANETGAAFDDSGNGYGIHAEGKNTNITIKAESHIVGQGQGGKSRSGNGYGVLIGENHYDDEAKADDSVFGNKLMLISSTLEGHGAGTDKNAGSDFSGNGYGLLIGHGYQYGDEGHENKAGILSSVHDNEIGIDSSTVIGSGSIKLNNSPKNTNSFSGNGYGLIIGSGSIYIADIDQDRAAFYVDSPVKNNKITILNNTALAGTGKNDNYKAGYSGGGYGLLIGNGAVVVDGVITFSTKADVSVHDNTITVFNCNLTGDGYGVSPVSYGYSGDGFGMLVGYGDLYKSTGTKGVQLDSSVTMNTVSFANNHVVADANGELGTSGSAWGVIVGGKYGKVDAAKLNTLSISNSVITLNANEKTAYGIWITSGLTIDNYTLENITRTDSGSEGEKIHADKANSKTW